MIKYKKIIFLDEENTALSPLAQAILKRKFNSKGIYGVQVESYGNVVLFPEPANPKIAEVAEVNGLSLIGHRASPINENLFNESTLVLTLDNDSKLKVYSRFHNAANVFTLREYVGMLGDIKYQIGRSVEEYLDLYDMLDNNIDLLVEKLEQL